MSHRDDKKILEIENADLVHELQQKKEELRRNSYQIDSLKAIVSIMHQLAKGVVECMPPSRVYTLFMQEKWYEFPLN